mmetsp:Transcript_8025/g.11885  ORF Transcript_8025/g.11885 Transcript_8025/m.11885 type:complete len:114 (+) Transcript_8025:186-527(+)
MSNGPKMDAAEVTAEPNGLRQVDFREFLSLHLPRVLKNFSSLGSLIGASQLSKNGPFQLDRSKVRIQGATPNIARPARTRLLEHPVRRIMRVRRICLTSEASEQFTYEAQILS